MTPGVVYMCAIIQLQAFLGSIVLVSSPGVRPYCLAQLNHYKASSRASMLKKVKLSLVIHDMMH